MIDNGMERSQAPTLLLAGARVDALTSLIEAQGGRVIDGGSAALATGRYVVNGARLCVVDLDDVPAEGLDALVGAAAMARGAVLLLAASDHPALDALIAAGATHWLSTPANDASIARALLLARRHVDRLSGGRERRREQSHKSAVVLSEQEVRERVAERMAHAAEPFHLMVATVSRIDTINATFGREIGDEVLNAAAARIATQAASEHGQVVRMGPTRFALLCDGAADACSALAERVAASVERPILAGHRLMSVGCRIGIVERRPDDDAPTLLRRAAAALNEAQAGEGAHIRVLSADEADAATLDAGLQADLRRALEADEIEILFQPQLAVADDSLYGVEALARWQHPVHGELGAATLFSVAERSDYLRALSAHVQARAIAAAAAWPATLAALRLSVNVTPVDLAQPSFVAEFLAMVDAHGIARDRLTVEITEGSVMADLEAAANRLAALRRGGCRVAIDDFGTGYSSLAWLKALPLDYLKIDKEFAQDIGGSPRDRIVVRGVIEMARSLGLAVVVEGVETEAQLALLAAEGCNFYQGFLFSGPVTSERLVAMVGDR